MLNDTTLTPLLFTIYINECCHILLQISHLEALSVIHNLASCLSLRGCGISEIFSFTFTTHSLMSALECVWTYASVHMHNTPVATKQNIQRGKAELYRVSRLAEGYRMCILNQNNRFLYPHLHLIIVGHLV